MRPTSDAGSRDPYDRRTRDEREGWVEVRGGAPERWHERLGAAVREPSGLRLMELLLTCLAKAEPTVTQETLMQVGQVACTAR